jgi:hypothetical protein
MASYVKVGRSSPSFQFRRYIDAFFVLVSTDSLQSGHDYERGRSLKKGCYCPRVSGLFNQTLSISKPRSRLFISSHFITKVHASNRS